MVTERAKRTFYETIKFDTSPYNELFTNFDFSAACFDKNLF